MAEQLPRAPESCSSSYIASFSTTSQASVFLCHALPRFCPQSLSTWPLSRYSKERYHRGLYTCRLFHQGLVLKFSHISLLPKFFEHLNPGFLPILTQGAANPLLFGATPPLGDSGFRDVSAGTSWAGYSGLLKLIMPCRLLGGFQEKTCVKDPAQCQA